MKISICVPFYGVEKYIERCARSVLEQTYPNIEYVFVNDCTGDRSLEILFEVINDYPIKKLSVKIISHKCNRGIAAARNTALENCTGDFMMFVDSDDYLEEKAVELLVSKQQETNADIVSGNAFRETKEGKELIIEPDYKDKDEMIIDCIKPTLNHVLWRRLIRLSLYRNHNIAFIEGVNVGEDWQVMPQLVYYADKIAKIDDVIYHYNCMNEGSYMSQKKTGYNRTMMLQDISSIDVLENFFANKETMFLAAVRNMKASYLCWYLGKAFKFRNSKDYNYIAQKISEMDISSRSYIGWDNPKAFFVNRNYYIRKLYEFFI